MFPPTIVTWILVVFALIFLFLLLLYGQSSVVTQPKSRKTKDLLIGKGEGGRARTLNFELSNIYRSRGKVK